MVLFIPIDFSIEFWNCTFPLAQKFLKGIFWTASARAFEWYKPRKRSYFRSKVINGFYRANSTWTYYSGLVMQYSIFPQVQSLQLYQLNEQGSKAKFFTCLKSKHTHIQILWYLEDHHHEFFQIADCRSFRSAATC